MPRELSAEELEELADRIIKKEISIRGAAEEYGISRNTLSRRLEKELQTNNPEKYKRLKEVNSRNQKSGGKLEKSTGNVYGDPKDIKNFYLTYLIYKSKNNSNKEIIEAMDIPKATFYRKMKAFHVYLEEDKISFTKEEFNVLSDEEKENVLVKKLRRRYKSLGDTPKSEEECKKRINDFVSYVQERENYGQTDIKLDKDKIYSIINSNIDIVRLSLNEKIKPNIENLDRLIGKDTTNVMLMNKPFIFSFSKERIEELLEVVNAHNKLETYSRSSDRSSPALLHALFKYAEQTNFEFKYVNQINKHAKKNRMTNELLLLKYPYKGKTQEKAGNEIDE